MRKILSKWYIYLLTVAIIVTGFCLTVSFKTAPKKIERFDLFVGACDIKVNELEKELNKKKPQEVKVAQVRFHYVTSSDFTYIFANFRADVDCFILPYKYVIDNEADSVKYAANLNVDYMNSELKKELIYYQYDNQYKGIKIFDSVSNEGALSSYIDYSVDNYKSDYYLFFSYKSNNLGKNNDGKTDRAIKMVKELFLL